MTFILVGEDRRITLPESVPTGPYELEVEGGVVLLHPLVRASRADVLPPAADEDGDDDADVVDEAVGPPFLGTAVSVTTSERTHFGRDFKGRSWSRVPAGTRLTGPRAVGVVVMGAAGELRNGRTPNQHLRDHGITANAWQVYHLDDGRTVGTAYDLGEWA